jgi:RNA ligase
VGKELLNKLDELVKGGYLRKATSDCGKLVTYNYTDHCVYEKYWNEYTLNARGTVYELETGKVVARAFPKFFNFGELETSKQRNILKQKDFYAFEKMDGSLGVIYFYDGKWRVNTRGSFSSDQAMEGQKMLDSGKYATHLMDTDFTYLVEIIYPENRIIVDYGNNRELVMLAIIDTQTGKELSPGAMQQKASALGFKFAEPHGFDSIEQVMEDSESLGKFEEGYVVLFNNGERVKFKSKEYLKLAAAINYMTPLHFWKNMKGSRLPEEFIESFPEEFRERVDEIADKLEYNFISLKNDIVTEFIEFKKTLCPVILNEPKQFKKQIGLNLSKLQNGHAFFSLVDDDFEQLDEYILKRIRPKANEL